MTQTYLEMFWMFSCVLVYIVPRGWGIVLFSYDMYFYKHIKLQIAFFLQQFKAQTVKIEGFF